MQLEGRWCIRSKRVTSKLRNVPPDDRHPCSVEPGFGIGPGMARSGSLEEEKSLTIPRKVARAN